MKLSILVPFRDADGTRTRAKDWIVARWAHFWPDAEIIEGTDDGRDPFNKSQAMNDAASRATGDTFILLDADTWVEAGAIRTALELIARGVPWVVPATKNFRMSREWSERVLSMAPSAPLPSVMARDCDTAPGPIVGFCHVLSRAAYESAGGMDERIRGWGGEDTCFVRATDAIVGKHHKLTVWKDQRGQRHPAIVVCLWHDRPRDRSRRRIWIGQDRRFEADKRRIVATYYRARSREAMLQVVAEAQAARSVST